ncbi:hypothetical protein IFM89_011282 [Coptis chinensis]|uniref:Uncharacterized protein n=1 Tax=Coptis chinensis TaxID=261450 RepID=A0A835LRK9_9MAGN|nr:hypothetical protein IFM89_011282 [Coptis chinensis]
MSDIGLDAYRFSISWSRLIPRMILHSIGRGDLNPKGLKYYNDLIDELISHGIEPHVTIYHLDLPQILEEEYGGWLNPKIIEDFTAYADVCFREFGDRVSHWTTVNEPNIMSLASFHSGQWPPRRCSQPGGLYNCSAGNSSVEPYIAMHHLLLSHASAAAVYRDKYQAKQKGFIGINVYAFWCTPLTNSTADIIATRRATDFYLGWAVDPLVFGDYPKIMKKNVGSRLPTFTKRESELSLIEYFKDYYGNQPVYVQENGFGTPYNETLDDDAGRIHYVSGYMGGILDAIRSGSNARGYFLWSFLDLFELSDGYKTRFGIVHVNFEDKDLKRRPKLSAQWYSNLIKKNAIVTKNRDHTSSDSTKLSLSH